MAKTKEVKEEAAPKAKSIVSSAYRDKYKAQGPDWLASFIGEHATLTKEVTKSVADGDGKKSVKTTVPAGVDVDALFKLAHTNGLDMSKYEGQKSGHGFAGRFRMTLRNMLQKLAKQRHGLHDVKGKFVAAPTDWLTAKAAPTEPTHTPKGVKIAPAKEAKAA